MLFDLDKHSDDRSSPLPNKHDQLNPASLMSRGTNSTNYTTQATNDSLITAGKNGQFTIVQTGSWTSSAATVLNNPGNGNYGSSNLILHQEPHNLGFQPGILCTTVSANGQSTTLPYISFGTLSSTQPFWFTYTANVDATYVYIMLNTIAYQTAATIGGGRPFKWFLLYQQSI